MRGRILYVEDNVDVVKILAKLLRSEGYEVFTSHTCAGAIELAKTQRIDLLIADLGLPDGSGLSLLAQVREHHPAKGIVCSSYDIGNDTFDAGYSAHMLKPIHFERLSSLVAEVLAAPVRSPYRAQGNRA